MIRKIIACIGIIFLGIVHVNLNGMLCCDSLESSGDESVVRIVRIEGQAGAPGSHDETSGPSSDNTPDESSDDSRESSDSDESKDLERSAINSVICKMLHTAKVQANFTGQLHTISPGQNLYMSIFALTQDSKQPPIEWKKGLWAAEGITLHESGLVGCELVGDLIKQHQIGATEHDDYYKLPARDCALLLATDCKNLDMMRVLLRGGASVNARSGDGSFPLFLAANDHDRDGAEEYPVDYCLACRADATQTTADGKTALHQAVRFGFMHGVCALTEKDACVNFQDIDGCTPLHYACIHIVSGEAAAQIARILLEAGALITIKNKAGKTPWQCALESKKPELIEILSSEVSIVALPQKDTKDAMPKTDEPASNKRVCNRLRKLSIKCESDFGPIDEQDRVQKPHVRASYCKRPPNIEPKPGKPLTDADRDTDDDSEEE